MRDLSTVDYHPTSEKIVDVLCQKTQTSSPEFFRVLTCYHLAKIAAMMRVHVQTRDRGELPVNVFAVNLASSGHGKGFSTNIFEDEIIHLFKSTFFDDTYPLVVDENLAKLALKRSYVRGEDPAVQESLVQAEFKGLGTLPFSFDSATTAAVKQMRHMLLMANIGAMNFEMDEMGSNLLSNADVLNTFLELYDVGKLKQKLTKNTKENVRSEEIDGRVPTNLLLFGTPAKLLDGSRTEEEFYSMLQIGYARRCLFGYSREDPKRKRLTPKEIYDQLVDTSSNQTLANIAADFARLASIVNYNKRITVPEPVSLTLIEYQTTNQDIADDLGEHEEIRKAELNHRHFKTLKLAGVYAFIDGHASISMDNIYSAMKMVETSGEAFDEILKRDRNYVKLAKYISSIKREVTHVDLMEDLPFYKGSGTARAELMALATAWGYKNQIVIRRSFGSSNIEFITGETLEKTDLDNMILSYSHDISDGYQNEYAPFDELPNLTQLQGMHWVNHHSINGHRSDDYMKGGFNMIVLDVDDGTTIETVRELLRDYKCFIHTTKRHTATDHRFRIAMPLNFKLTMDSEEYKEFMRNIFEWLPFEVDAATGQRARKWQTCPGHYEFIDGGELLDAMEFIPKTTKNDERKQSILKLGSLNNLERWFFTQLKSGNRNNCFVRYALMLVDSGVQVPQVRDSILALNNKLDNKLSVAEIDSTIMRTVARRVGASATP